MRFAIRWISSTPSAKRSQYYRKHKHLGARAGRFSVDREWSRGGSGVCVSEAAKAEAVRTGGEICKTNPIFFKSFKQLGFSAIHITPIGEHLGIEEAASGTSSSVAVPALDLRSRLD
jgi:hypothetical protein